MYQKSIKIQNSDKAIDDSILAKEIVKNLEKVRARNIEIIGNRITFTGGLFRFVTNWNILVPITRGEIRIDRTNQCVQYTLNFSQLIIIGTIMVIAAGIFAISNGAPASFLLFTLPFIWIWLVGMNLIIGIPRFNALIRSIIKSAGLNI